MNKMPIVTEKDVISMVKLSLERHGIDYDSIPMVIFDAYKRMLCLRIKEDFGIDVPVRCISIPDDIKL